MHYENNHFYTNVMFSFFITYTFFTIRGLYMKTPLKIFSIYDIIPGGNMPD